ncbi:MAG: energy transducer TonB [Bacteroidota bacterium]
MKKFIVFILFMCTAVIVFAQEPLPKTDRSLNDVNVSPATFMGVEYVNPVEAEAGTSLIDRYLAKNVTFPPEAAKYRYQGTEVVQFTVTPEGKVTDFKFVNSVCSAVDEEMIRVLKSTEGMWKPGIRDGQLVYCPKEVSMVFVNEDNFNTATTTAAEYFNANAIKHFTSGNISLFEKNNVKKALRQYEKGINYLPNDQSLLLVRGICRYELGDREGAIEDWGRLKANGGLDMSEIAYRLVDLKGYNQLVQILEK